MRKNIVLTGLILFLGAGLSAQSVVSVLFFENLTGNTTYQWMSRSLADGLSSTLKGGALTLVERENLEDVIKEQKLSLSGLTDENTALEIGRILNTNQLIGGTFLIHENTLRVTARITDTTSGEILFSCSVENTPDRYFSLEKELARELAAYYGFTINEKEGHETASIPALSRYYEGLLFLDSASYAEAAQAFQNSLLEDPAFLHPRESLEDSYRFLKDFKKARYQREMNTLYRRLSSLLQRASAEPYVNYGDWVRQVMAEGMSAEEISGYTQSHPEITWGNTRAEALWHGQTVMMQIGLNAAEYFQDEVEAQRMYDQMINISHMAQAEMPEDPFLPEIIYQEVLALTYKEDWPRIYELCEMLMVNWPDFRMMWAIEDFYERSLEHLEKNPEFLTIHFIYLFKSFF